MLKFDTMDAFKDKFLNIFGLRCMSYTVLHFPTITQVILKSADQAVNPERKISVFNFHKPNICRKPAVVHLAEQNNHSVAMNHNT
jgi:hypothetical protein